MRLLLLAALLLSPMPASADDAGDARNLAILRDLDGRLAGIGFRLATANLPLCSERQAMPGLALHALDQYAPPLRAAARTVFGLGRGIGVEAVVAGSVAEHGGVRPGDTVLAIAGAPMPEGGDGPAISASRDAALATLTAQPADRPLHLTIQTGGQRRDVTLPPSPGCRVAFELLLGSKPEAQSDGHVVQVGAAYFARFGDNQVAVVVAHELAHIILRHRARLEQAGVKWGVLAEFGRSGRIFRRTEDEADALGAVLLRNAGYDPELAVTFWQHDIGGLDGGIFHSRTHGSAGARARAIAVTIAAIPPGAPVPWIPPVIATRDQPLD